MLGTARRGEISRCRTSAAPVGRSLARRRRCRARGGGGPGRASWPSARRWLSPAGRSPGSADGVRLGLGLLGVLLRLLVLVGLEQVGGVEERALLLADVDERGLDAGQHRFDPAEVDVADGAAMVGAIDEELDQPIVFEDGHAGFPLAPVDQDLALQG